jgi:small subunit ribosomal protein S4
VNIPSYKVKKDETLALIPKIKASDLMKDLPAALKKYEAPAWLSLDKEKIEAKVLNQPSADELGDLNPVGLVVEFYSR